MVDKHIEKDFEVQGAGFLRIGTNANSWCGTAAGFTVGASWSRHFPSGGVMDRDEAKRLADMIYAALESAELKPRAEVCRIKVRA